MNIKQKSSKIFSKINFVEKYSIFIDNLVFIISLWISIWLFITFKDAIPNQNWHWHADRILLLILSFSLVYATLYLFKMFLFFGIIIGVLFLLFYIFFEVYEDYRDPRKTEQKHIYQFDPNQAEKLINKFMNPDLKSDSLSKEILKLEKRISILDYKIDSANKIVNHIDSLQRNSQKKNHPE